MGRSVVFSIDVRKVVGDEARLIDTFTWFIADGLEGLLAKASDVGRRFPEEKLLFVDVMDGPESRCRITIENGNLADVICDPSLFR